jgi:hypothetical protein
MDYLLTHTKLSKDINSIICKYINYSNENILRLIPKIRTKTLLKLKPGITFFDIMIECVKKGYSGFYITEHYSDTIKTIDNELYEKNKNIISKTKCNTEYYYEFICLAPGDYYCQDLMTTLHDFMESHYIIFE